MSEHEIQRLYDAQAIQTKVTDLGSRLQGEGQPPPLIVCLIDGSVIFLADLVRSLDESARYGFIQVQYSASDNDTMEIHYPISLDLSGQRLLVLKDVVTTGVIETYLTSQFLSRGAVEVRFAALIDLPEERRTEFAVHYALFTPKRTGTFVGYGLKYKGLYGNLGYIGRLSDA